MQVGIVGCGLIGKKRAAVIRKIQSDQVVAVVDTDTIRAETLAKELGCIAYPDWNMVIQNPDIDVFIVATPNKFLMPVTVEALRHGKHVLCEKPPGRNISETRQMADAARQSDCTLKIGFNHRYHPAIMEAHQLFSEGVIGEPMFIRSVYGHGGRAGYEKEWRGQADLSGGGELLDQGVHIVDLCRWFLGEFNEAFGYTRTFFWPLGYYPDNPERQLEDNAFAMIKTPQGQVAEIHTSWTQWKNRFLFEIFGKNGFIQIDGLGGSYGIETLTIGKRRPESGPPDIEHIKFEDPDVSWLKEWEDFTCSIQEGHEPLSCGEDSIGTMKVIDAIYRSSQSGRPVDISL